MGKEVFISYSTKDASAAQMICSMLEEEGLRCWIAPRDITPGQEWAQAIVEAITRSGSLLLLLSEASNRSPQVLREVERAVHYSVPIVTVRLSATLPSGGMEYYLSAVHWFDAFPGAPDAYRRDLTAVLKQVLQGAEPARVQNGTAISPIAPGQLVENIPARNLQFTGREEVLRTLHDNFFDRSQSLQAISGLGGIGKTGTAIEYAHRFSRHYRTQFWAHADTDDTLTASFQAIAETLQLPAAKESDQSQAVAAVRDWLKENKGWLLILDNADHPEMVRPYLPKNCLGHVLLTSRAQVFDSLGIGRPLFLEALSSSDALQFMVRRTGREGADDGELQAAAELAEELGRLPLALEQAAAYIAAKQCRFSAYLAAFRSRRISLLERSRPVTGEYPASVATTWALNFAEVEQDPAASDILRLSCYLHADAIPQELLTLSAAELGPTIAAALADANSDPLLLDEVLEPLTRFSLIRRNIAEETYSIHRLVQSALRDGMDPESQKIWIERAALALAQAFPAPEVPQWPRCERLLQHALFLVHNFEEVVVASTSTVTLLSRSGTYAFERGKYGLAEDLHRRTLAILEADPTSSSFLKAQCLNSLGSAIRHQGREREAEPLIESALSLYQADAGNEPLDICAAMHNLADLYRTTGRIAHAERMFEALLEKWDRLNGPQDCDQARFLIGLANVYRERGKHKDSIALFERALPLLQADLGPEHPEVARGLDNLAITFAEQEDYAAAEPLFKQALRIRESLLGSEHPAVARSLGNLATLYSSMERFHEAEELFERTLKLQEAILGSDHLDIAYVVYGLAEVNLKQKRYEAAKPLFERALRLAETLISPEHWLVADILRDYARLLAALGDVARAEEMERRSQAIIHKYHKTP